MPQLRRARELLRSRRDAWTVALALASLAVAVAVGGWTWRADRLVYDFGLSLLTRPVPADIVIVAIDEASIEAIGRWPWPRAVHSTLLAKLAQMRPRAIGLDIILSEPDPDPEQDRLLAQMLQRAAPVVLPVVWTKAGPGQPSAVLQPVEPIAQWAQIGVVEPTLDVDGVLRSAFLYSGPLLAGRMQPYPHFALQVLLAGGESLDPAFPSRATNTQSLDSLAAGGRPGQIGWDRDGRFQIRYLGPPGHIQRVSYLDVLRGAVPAEQLAGRYVMVGMTAYGLGDTMATPVNAQQQAMPGVEVHSNVLNTLRSGDYVRELQPWYAAALSGLLVLLLLAALEAVGARWALVLALVSVPVAVVVSLWALNFGYWWSPVPYGLAAALAYPLWSWRRLERAVDSLDVEIRHMEAEGGVPVASHIVLSSKPDRRDRFAVRLESLHAATDTVRSARRFLADAVAGMPTAMLVAEEGGRVLMANTRAARLFETENEADMQGWDLPGLLEEFRSTQEVDWAALFTPDGLPDGGRVVEAQLARLGDLMLNFASLEVLGQRRWVVTFDDVTAIKQAQRRREETLAFISHDLRSPANAIMMLSDLHLQGHMQMDQKELLTEIRRLAQRTQQLSDDVVRLAHAESRPLRVEEVPLAALLEEVMADFRPQARGAHVELLARMHDEQARWPMDRPLLLRALGNLVSNAIKHSPQGAQVQLQTAPGEERLMLRVIDEGPGMTAEQRQKLHNETQGLPAGDARGVGLGLLFVQRVAGRHRGQLLVRPRDDDTGNLAELQLGILPCDLPFDLPRDDAGDHSGS